MDKQREAFEAWASGEGLGLRGDGESYYETCTHFAWQAWQAAQQAQWLPIETAPMDGRPVLCGWNNGEEPCVCYWREIVSGWSGWHGYPEFDEQPTHWMPLPPEPQL